MNEFKKLGLSDVTINAIIKKGFIKPTPIQEKTIPLLLKGEHDIIGQAQTGTGKTACFALPILENLRKGRHVQALILAPTRELAVQITTEINSLKGDRKVNVTTIYGGASIKNQMDDLKRGVDIVVGTPGRVIDLINRRKLDITQISYAVLDEADEMLNMGFVEDIEEILSSTKADKKMLLFSATIPKGILRIAKKFMRKYEMVSIDDASAETGLIEQTYYEINAKDRYAALKRLIAVNHDFQGIVFCKTKVEVNILANQLTSDKYLSGALHGDISQGQRENMLKQLKDKKINILIATDVAARGIDVNNLSIVINYSLPQSPEMYIHRIGRTGRAGNKGSAITFLIPSENRKLRSIERLINQKIIKSTLPTIDEIIALKKEQIESTIQKIIESGKQTGYNAIAKKLLVDQEPEKVVASVLRYAFMNELDLNTYKNIEQVSGDDYSSNNRRRHSRGGSRNRDQNQRNSSKRRNGFNRTKSRSGGRRRYSHSNSSNQNYRSSTKKTN